MADSVDRWRTIASEEMADCRVFRVRRDDKQRVSDHADRAGQPHSFYVIDSPDWVNVVAITTGGDVVLARQYRQGVERITLEVPGGLVDPGEEALQAAKRELLEETGYASDTWIHLGTTAPNPAIQSNRLDTYLALEATAIRPPEFDSTEHITLKLVSFSESLAMISSGAIDHALVIVALHRAAAWLATQRETDGDS